MATARDPAAVGDLVARFGDQAQALAMDVTEPGSVEAAVAQALDRFGAIDVVVNNAGRSVVGAFEDLSLDQVRSQLEVNLLGAWHVIRAVLPTLRRQGSGTIVNVSSQGGLAATPGTAAYSASKFALEGMSEALDTEVAGMGLRVLIVEPGAFRTDVRRSLETPAARRPDSPYADFGADVRARHGEQRGDPRLAAAAIVAAVEAPDPPLRLVLGADALENIRRKLTRVDADIRAWEATTVATDFAEAPSDGRPDESQRHR